MTASTIEALETEMKDISQTIEAAARTAADGGAVNLVPLSVRVENLCASLVELPAVNARKIGSHLPKIAQFLESIAQTLTERGIGAGSAPPDSPMSHKKAAQAYAESQPLGRR